jgi:hypothetical protein
MPGNTTITVGQLQHLVNETAADNASRLNTFYLTKGNSTYSFSFGVLRFDVGNDTAVQQFLLNNGFTQQQINQLSQPNNLTPNQLGVLDTQLQAVSQNAMDAFVNTQLQDSITQVDNLIDILLVTNSAVGQALADYPQLQLRIAAYDNQYHSSGYGATADPNSPLATYFQGVILTSDRTQLPPGDMDTAEEELNEALSQFMFGSQQQETGLGAFERTGTLVQQEEGAWSPAPIKVDSLGVNPPAGIYDMHVCEGLF